MAGHEVAHGQRLSQPSKAFAGDRGEPDEMVRRALAVADGQLGYLRAVAALCASRLLMPIVASGDEGSGSLRASSGELQQPDPTRHAEMVAVTITNEAGERALLGFTGIDSLTTWRADARPVPCTLDDLAATVAESGATHLLVDVAGPHQLVIAPELVTELAQGHRLVEVEPGAFGWMFVADESGDVDESAGPPEGHGH